MQVCQQDQVLCMESYVRAASRMIISPACSSYYGWRQDSRAECTIVDLFSKLIELL